MPDSIMTESTTPAAVETAAADTTPSDDASYGDDFEFNLFPDDDADVEQATTPPASAAQPAQIEPKPSASPAASTAMDKPTEAATDASAPESIPFKHNHETRQLSKAAVADIASALGAKDEDVVALLQKGYDYDGKFSRLADLDEARAAHSFVDEFAKRQGMTQQQAIEQLRLAMDNAQLADYRAKVQAAHPEFEGDAVELVARQQFELDRKQAAEASQQRDREQQDYFQNEWVAFWKAYPDAAKSVDELPDSVKHCFEAGQTPNEAWLAYQMEQRETAHAQELEALKLQLAQIEKKTANKNTSIGSVAAEVDTPANDAFLAGLFSD